MPDALLAAAAVAAATVGLAAIVAVETIVDRVAARRQARR